MILWTIVFALGAFSVVFAVASRLLKRAEKKLISDTKGMREAGISDGLQRWILKAEKELGKKEIFKRLPLIVVVPLSFLGIVFGLSYFHNLAAAILLGVVGILLPDQIIYSRMRAKQEKVMEQLGVAVRMFAAEFRDTPNVLRAISIITPRLPEPIGAIFRQAERGFLSGRDMDETLISLSKQLNFEYGLLFVQLLRLGIEDSAVGPMFFSLATRLSGQQKRIRQYRVNVAVDRYVAIFLNIAMIPVYVFTVKVLLGSADYFVNIVSGRAIITVCLISVVVGLGLNRVIGGETA